jgi:hypothetical protein
MLASLASVSTLKIVPVTLREASAFIAAHHRHHAAPRGMKFAVGLVRADIDEALARFTGQSWLVGVATAGRPVARLLDPRCVLEVNRTCTDGTRNANSMLYGAVRRAGVAMGYEQIITYTELGESGAPGSGSTRTAGRTAGGTAASGRATTSPRPECPVYAGFGPDYFSGGEFPGC